MVDRKTAAGMIAGAGLVVTVIALPAVTNIATSTPLPEPLAWIGDLPWVVLVVLGFVALALSIIGVTFFQGADKPRSREGRSKIDARGRTLQEAVLMIGRRSEQWRREAIVADALSLLRTQSRATVLYGLPGTGKTTLMAQVAKECVGKVDYGIYLTFDGYQAEDDAGFILLQLNRFLAGFGRALDEQTLQQSPRAALLRRMAVSLDGIRVLVLIDGLHHATPTTQFALLEALDGINGVKVLATSDEAPSPRLGVTSLHVPDLTPTEYQELARVVCNDLQLTMNMDELLAQLPNEIRTHPRTLVITLGYLRDRPLELLPADATSDIRLVQHTMASLSQNALQVLTLLSMFHGCDVAAMITHSGRAPFTGLEDEMDVLIRRALIDRIQPTIEVPTLVVAALNGVGGSRVPKLRAMVTGELLRTVENLLSTGRNLSQLSEILTAVAHNLTLAYSWPQALKLCNRQILEELNRRGYWNAYLALLRIGIRAASNVHEGDLAVELELRLARKLTQLGSFEEAAQMLDIVSRQLGDGSSVAHAQLAAQHGLLSLVKGDTEAARESFEVSRDLAVVHDDRTLLAAVYKQLGHVYEALDRPQDAWDAYETAGEHASTDSKYFWDSQVNLALLDAKANKLKEAMSRIDRAIRGMAASGYDAGIPRANLAYAEIVFARGNHELAIGLARQVRDSETANDKIGQLAGSMLRRFERSS